MTLINRKNVLIALIAIVALSVPLTIGLLQTQQETRSRASASTSLAFSPTSSTASPIQKNVGDTVTLDLMVTPGNNQVTFVKFQLSYDPTKLEPIATDPFVLNKDAFLTKDGPIVTPGSLLASASVGSDPTKSIRVPTKIGTITFKAIGSTNGAPIVVTFTNLTQALSSGPNDQASENVLSTTSPAAILIGGDNAVTPGPSVTGSPTVAPTPASTPLTFELLLHGVGSAGDNPNPRDSELSNKNPLHPQRNLHVEIFDTNNVLVASVSGPLSLNYDDQSGSFKGTLDLGQGFREGNYNLKVKTDRYLRRRVPGIQLIKPKSQNKVPKVDLVAGDVNGDNILNVIDYNAFLDCGYGEIEPLPVVDPNSVFNSTKCQAHNPPELVDVDDNGIINSPDYNLFLRELSVQNGD